MSVKRHPMDDLAQDMQDHVDRETEDNIARGMTPEAARRKAQVKFGNRTLIQEDTRAVWVRGWLERVAQDVRYALRLLRRSPVFSAAAILSLALGIGANAAVFSLVRAVLFAPLPYAEPERIVMLYAKRTPGDGLTQVTSPDFLAWQERAHSFEAMATERQLTGDVAGEIGGAAAETVPVQAVRSTMFQVLGVQPSLGRVIRPDDHPTGVPAPVAVISDRLWTRRFNHDPRVVGRTIRIDGVPTTIVGVMPPDFAFWDTRATDLWTPLSFSPSELRVSGRAFAVAARLKPGVTVAQAQAEMDVITAQMAKDLPDHEGWDARVMPLREALSGNYRYTFILLQTAVGCVLLIACVNVAGLLLARASTRRAEVALRGAIGATRWRLTRQLLTESVLLSGIGGLVGLGFGWLALRLLVPLSGGLMPGLQHATLNGPVIVVAAFASIVTGLLFGCVPAIHASRSNLLDALKTAAKGAGRGSGERGVQLGLVVVQVALAVVLLVGSGLLINSFLRIRANDLGADPRGVLTFTLQFSNALYQKRVGGQNGVQLLEISPVPAETFRQLWERLQSIRRLGMVSGISTVPFVGNLALSEYTVSGYPEGQQTSHALQASTAIITPKYFETLAIPFVRGRDFNAQDSATSPWGVIINEALADRLFPSQDALGQHLTLQLVPNDLPREVIGVVANTKFSPYEQMAAPIIYTHYLQQPPMTRWPYGGSRRSMSFLVRPGADITTTVAAIRRTMTELDPNKPITEIHWLEADLAKQLSTPRFLMTLLSVFAAAAVLLSCIGIYGVIAYRVAQRTHEVGIRVALGASRSSVALLMTGRVVVLALVGVIVGLVGAFTLSQVLAGMLWNVKPTDPVTYAGVALLMAVVALVAALVPARRALTVSPTVALRQE